MSRAFDPNLLKGGAPPRPTVLPPHLGTRLKGRYELIQMIGRGGMSTVFHAVDHVRLRARAPQPHVAIKLATLAEPYARASRELIHREAQRTLDLVHPNIVRVYDSDSDGDSHFLVMELLQGRTLAAVLKEQDGKGLEWRQVAGIVAAMGKALAFAHGKGMVHGDLKPGNVFIARDGALKVLDFGLSQRTGAADPQDADSTVHLLNTVGALTPSFASPERLEGAAPAPACDVFAFGILTYLLLTGHHPFQRSNATDARDAGAMVLRPEGLAPHRWRALQAALAFQAARRPARVDDFAARFLAPSWRPALPRLRQRGWPAPSGPAGTP